MWVRTNLLVLFTCLVSIAAEAGPRLDAIKARGVLHCGVAGDLAGMSQPDANGDYQGFETDFCRAIAAAILGQARVVFYPTSTMVAFLQSDEIDVVLRGLTHTFRREVSSDLRFGPTVFYDGQAFLTRTALGIRTLAELSEKSICVSSDIYADFYPPLRRYFDEHDLVLNAVGTRTRAQSEDRFFAEECDAVTADTSELASAIVEHAVDPERYEILPGQITKEPLAPLMRKGDEEFFAAVSWAIYALINAEELGIDSAALDSMRGSSDPDVAAFFEPPPAASGLDPAWSYAIVQSVGNYGEIFARHLGGTSAANLPRGPNRLWTEGGLLYAPPIR